MQVDLRKPIGIKYNFLIILLAIAFLLLLPLIQTIVTVVLLIVILGTLLYPLLIKFFLFLVPLRGEKPEELFYTSTKSGWQLATFYYPPNDSKLAFKTPIVLVPGLMMNHNIFNLEQEASLISYLTQKNYHVYAIDPHGCGKSYHTSLNTYTDFNFDDMVGDVEDIINSVLNHFKHLCQDKTVSSVHWVGHSLGALMMYSFLDKISTEKQKKIISSFVSLSAPLDMKELDHTIFDHLIIIYKIVSRLTGYMQVRYFFGLCIPLAGIMYTTVDSFLYNKKAITPSVMRRLFAYGISDISNGLFKQVIDFVQKGMKSEDASSSYEALSKSVKIPILMMTGNIEYISPPDILQKHYELVTVKQKGMVILSKANGFKYNYCHLSIVAGKESKEEVFPIIFNWFDKIK